MDIPRDQLYLFLAFYMLSIPAIYFGDLNDRFEVSEFELFLTLSVLLYFPILIFLILTARWQR